jgi:hypothetical protein
MHKEAVVAYFEVLIPELFIKDWAENKTLIYRRIKAPEFYSDE